MSYDSCQGLGTIKSQVINAINKYVKVHRTDVKDRSFEIIGRVGSGYMNINPAGLIVFLDQTNNVTTVIARAVAKEDLIKQNTSEKVIESQISDIESDSEMSVVRFI